MSAESDLFNSLRTLYLADSGAGGLNGSGTANVPFFLSDDDADSDAAQNTPYITCDFAEGVIDGYSNGVMSIPFKMVVTFNRDNEKTEGRLAAVLNRIRTVFHRAALASGSVWSFAPATISRIVSLGNNGKFGRKAVEFRCTATKLIGV